MASISYFATARRSACERCRKQKLRCPPQPYQYPGQPCDRCVRADVSCYKGYTRPRGYSAKVIGGDSSPRRKHVSQPSGALLELMSSEIETTAESSSTTGDENRLLWFLGGNDSHYLPSLEHDNLNTPSQDDINGSISTFNRDLSPTASDIHARFPEASTAECPIPPQVANGSLATVREGHCQGRSSPGSDFSRMLQDAEVDIRLSQLNLDLCKQLKRQLNLASEIFATQGNPWAAFSSDAFGDALNSTDEYISIIQGLVGGSLSSTSSPSGSPSANSDSGTQLRPSLVCALGLESCYFRIVNLFNGVLAHLDDQLHQADHEASQQPVLPPLPPNSQSVLPGLRLAGFHVRQAGLQAKIVFQATIHQFEVMEKLLGLPAELRVSGRGMQGADDNSCGFLCESWLTTTARMQAGVCGEQAQAVDLLRQRIIRTQKTL